MNITKATEKYIESHPSVKDCVKKKLVNYSSLSRTIIKDLSLRSNDFDAVLIASRRYARTLSSYTPQEDSIIRLLEKSTLEVKNKISVVVVDHSVDDEDLIAIEKKAKKSRGVFYEIEGTEVITLVISSSLLADVRLTFKGDIEQVWNGLALVIIQSPKELEETPGSLAYLASLLAHNNINIVENMSCWNETLFVVEEKDIGAVVSLLSF